MRSRSAVSVLLIWLLAILPVAARNDCLALLTASVLKGLGNYGNTVLRIAKEPGAVSDGLAAALRSRPTDAGERVRKIFEVLQDDGARIALSKLAPFDKVEGLGVVVASLGAQLSSAKGGLAQLRYATDVITPSQVARFELDVTGGVIDIIDKSGRGFEVKDLDLEKYIPFQVVEEFEDIQKQLLNFEAYGNSVGQTVTLVFANPVPPQYQALFDSYFAEILARGRVVFTVGF